MIPREFRKKKKEILAAAEDALAKMKKRKHVYKNIGKGVFDEPSCSCGWRGQGFWDGSDLAYKSWLEHIADALGLIPKKCVCGKSYVPFEGGKACHKIKRT